MNTYASPGGGAVRRSVNPGIYLSVRAETTVGSQTWFKTAQGDWIAASAVTFMRPSELRGIELGEAPPPPPPPPSTDTRQGIVTATTLNVRARPGVAADNPPIGTLRSGAAVTIYAEQRVAGELWYRIGEGRWVHGGYVRINTAVPPPPLPTPPASDTRRGIVTATALNVRARPGAAANNPPVAVLRAGVAVTVYEARSIGGETWYRIGENRWVLGQWVRLLDASRSMAAAAVVPEMTLPTRLPAGWVVTSTLNVRARPGVTTDNPPVGQISHNQAVPILEERSVSGVRWFRIAEGQWVEGRNIGVAARQDATYRHRSRRALGRCLSGGADRGRLRGRSAGLCGADRVRSARHAYRPGDLPHLAAAGYGQDVGARLLPGGCHLDMLLLQRLRTAYGLLARRLRQATQPRLCQHEPA